MLHQLELSIARSAASGIPGLGLPCTWAVAPLPLSRLKQQNGVKQTLTELQRERLSRSGVQTKFKSGE
jgi:hypothetical protein